MADLDVVAERRPPQQLDRRRRVIDAAFELGADGGYDAVQMRDVAATANVALATIYRYFSSKDHLLAAAMSEWTTACRVASRSRRRRARRQPTGSSMCSTARAARWSASPNSAPRSCGRCRHPIPACSRARARSAADPVDGRRHPRRPRRGRARRHPRGARPRLVLGAHRLGQRPARVRVRGHRARAGHTRLVEPYEAELRTSRADGHKR